MATAVRYQMKIRRKTLDIANYSSRNTEDYLALFWRWTAIVIAVVVSSAFDLRFSNIGPGSAERVEFSISASALAEGSDAPFATSAPASTLHGWRVDGVGGGAEFRVRGSTWGEWRRLRLGDVLRGVVQISTRKGGQVRLSLGGDTITVASNGIVELPDPALSKSAIRVRQEMGVVRYDVESRRQTKSEGLLSVLSRALFSTRQPGGGFEVETPYLIAGVKGTSFEVSVSEEGSEVTVSEGAVSVTEHGGSTSVSVTAGQKASVARGGAGVSVSRAIGDSTTQSNSAIRDDDDDSQGDGGDVDSQGDGGGDDSQGDDGVDDSRVGDEDDDSPGDDDDDDSQGDDEDDDSLGDDEDDDSQGEDEDD